jgi:hypothetical protein
MKFEEIFFSKFEQRRLLIYHWLLANPQEFYDLDELSKKWGLSQAKLRTSLEKINEDLETFEMNGSKLNFQKRQFNVAGVLPPLDVYRAYLFKHTLHFKFLMNLLTQEFHTLEEFAEAQGMHMTSVERKTRSLRNLAKENNISLKRGNILELTGQELNIRFFFFYVLWTGISGNFNPFDEVMNETTEEILAYVREKYFSLNENTTVEYRGRLMSMIVYYRTRANNFVVLGKNTIDMLNERAADVDMFEKIGEFSSRKMAQNELCGWHILSLFIHQTVPQVYEWMTHLPRTSYTTNLFKQFRTTANDIYHFLVKNKEITFVARENNKTLLKSLFVEMFLMSLLRNDFVDINTFQTNSYKEFKSYALLKQELRNFHEEHSEELGQLLGKMCVETFVHRLSFRLHTFFKEEKDYSHRFRIGVAVENDKLSFQYLEDHLNFFSNATVETYSKEHQPYDFLVTTSSRIVSENNAGKVYHWGIFSDDVHHLLREILEAMFEKENSQIDVA